MLLVVMVGLIVIGGWKVQTSVNGLELSAGMVWLKNFFFIRDSPKSHVAIIWLGASLLSWVYWVALVSVMYY